MEQLNLGTYKVIKQHNQYTTRLQRAKHQLVKTIKKVLKLLSSLSLVSFLVASIFTAGQFSTTQIIYAEQKPIVQTFPILQRIAGCESEGNPLSKGSQFDSKGRLRTHVNKDGTIDIGKNMINTYFWELKAVSLGYNIYTEQGNDSMAEWIYLNKGTGDWSASSKCWSK